MQKETEYQIESKKHIYLFSHESSIRMWFWIMFILLTIILFLPWTQNIRAKGIVTTLRQEQRPQEINSIIPGRITKWYVKEGDFVKKGDTLMQLSEVKENYMDPVLVGRTSEQISAKSSSIDFYKGKAKAAENQIAALELDQKLKLEQLKNKIIKQQRDVESYKIEVKAAQNELTVATRQLEAGEKMLASGVISLIDFERRKVVYQQAQAKKISAENKLANASQELTILSIEKNSISQDYAEKIAKANGDRFQALSQAASTESEIAKLKIDSSNYSIRNDMYFILAPQNGQVINARKSGIGELIKEGEKIAVIVPENMDRAVELFVRPNDLPLISLGQEVRFWFDGFPAIVFSGWPRASYGTFGGKIRAIESNVNVNGKFRILVSENPDDKPWPVELKIGTGAQGMALLKNVPVWYELWRNVNGFPPDFYKVDQTQDKEKK